MENTEKKIIIKTKFYMNYKINESSNLQTHYYTYIKFAKEKIYIMF